MKTPKLVISEWIPFGVIQFESLSSTIEKHKPNRRIYLSYKIKDNPSEIVFKTGKHYAQISNTNNEAGKFIELEANIKFPEEKVQQEEVVDVIITRYGSILYSGEVIKSDYQDTYISIDRLSRIISDLEEDSSSLLFSLSTNYQIRAMKVVYPHYQHKGFEKSKIVGLFAESSNIGENLVELLSNEAFVEVEQIIGEIKKIVFYGTNRGFIEGRAGTLVIGNFSKNYMTIVLWYLQIKAFKQFLSDLYSRIWFMWDELRELRRTIFKVKEKNIPKILERLSQLDGDIITLKSITSTMRYTENYFEEKSEKLSKKMNDVELVELIERLDVLRVLDEIKNELQELPDFINAIETEIVALRDIASTINENQLAELRRIMTENITHQAAMQFALEMIEIVIIGVYGFEVGHIFVEFLGKALELSDIAELFIVLLISVLFSFAGYTLISVMKSRYLKHYSNRPH